MNFFTLSKEEGFNAARNYLVHTDWNPDSASSLINCVKKSGQPKFKDVITGVFLTKRTNSKKKVRTKKADKLEY